MSPSIITYYTHDDCALHNTIQCHDVINCTPTCILCPPSVGPASPPVVTWCRPPSWPSLTPRQTGRLWPPSTARQRASLSTAGPSPPPPLRRKTGWCVWMLLAKSSPLPVNSIAGKNYAHQELERSSEHYTQMCYIHINLFSLLTS